MARINGEIVIDRPDDVVFDYVADQSNEPQYNPQMVRAALRPTWLLMHRGVSARHRSAPRLTAR
jgi:hypothetical protein